MDVQIKTLSKKEAQDLQREVELLFEYEAKNAEEFKKGFNATLVLEMIKAKFENL